MDASTFACPCPPRVKMRLMITNQLVKPAYWDMPLALYFGEYSKVKHQRCILLMGHDFPLTKEELIGWGGLNYYSYWMQQGRVVCEYYATHTEYDEDGNLRYVDRDGNGVLNNDEDGNLITVWNPF